MGDDDDTVSRDAPNNASTHHFKSKPFYAEAWGCRGVGEPLPGTAGIFVFYVYKMLRFRLKGC